MLSLSDKKADLTQRRRKVSGHEHTQVEGIQEVSFAKSNMAAAAKYCTNRNKYTVSSDDTT
jgi:hypothetical protein